jgi:hypothetical protein
MNITTLECNPARTSTFPGNLRRAFLNRVVTSLKRSPFSSHRELLSQPMVSDCDRCFSLAKSECGVPAVTGVYPIYSQPPKHPLHRPQKVPNANLQLPKHRGVGKSMVGSQMICHHSRTVDKLNKSYPLRSLCYILSPHLASRGITSYIIVMVYWSTPSNSSNSNSSSLSARSNSPPPS